MVDLPPEALLNRLKRGAVYPPEMAQQARQNFFKESTLDALRELALRQTAHEVNVRYAASDAQEQRDAGTSGNEALLSSSTSPRDSILICVTSDPASAALIRRGRRVADYLQADCFAVFVHKQADLNDIPAQDRQAVEKHLNFARNLHIETRVLVGAEVAKTLVDFAHLHRVTQIFLARPRKIPRLALLGPTLVHRVLRLARDIQVTIVAERRHNAGSSSR